MLAAIAAIFDFGCNPIRLAGSSRVREDWDWVDLSVERLTEICTYYAENAEDVLVKKVTWQDIISVTFGDFQIALLSLKHRNRRRALQDFCCTNEAYFVG